MKLPVIRGVIERRILVNFRVDPELLSPFVPAPFRPKRVCGAGMAGICLIRLARLRPAFLPPWMGIRSENAAHRIAVEWEEDGVTREGVFVPRRDTNRRFNVLAGGRIFPGVHHHARFDVSEMTDRFEIAVRSDDGEAELAVRARRSDRLPASSIFRSLAEASDVFREGSHGYSPRRSGSACEGLELRSHNWHVEPLDVEQVESSFFRKLSRVLPGSVEFDCALLMENIAHEWHVLPDVCCGTARGLGSDRQLSGKVAVSV